MEIRRLGAFERALLRCDQYSPFNIILAMHIKGSLEPGVLCQAIETVRARHALLNARVGWADGQPSFMSISEKEKATPFRWEARQDDWHWFEVIQTEMGSRLDTVHGPLFACIYLYGDRRSEIVLKFHHTIADAIAVENFANEVLDRSAKIAAGEQQYPLPESELLPPVDTRFPDRYRGFSRTGSILGYAYGQLADETKYRWQARGRRIPPLRGASKLQILTAHTPEPVALTLAARARERGITLANLLNAALLLAVNHHLYLDEPGPRRTFVFANLRPFTRPPLPESAFGCALSMLRYTIALKPEDSVWDIAAALQSQVQASFKRGDKFTASLMSEPLMKTVIRLKAFRMATAALSYTAIRSIRPTYGALEITGLYGLAPSLDLGPECSAMVALFNNQLWWGFTYFRGDLSPEQAQAIADEINFILDAASRPVPIPE